MTFRVGQKVVCIKIPVGGYGDEVYPIVGRVYTIRVIETGRPRGVNPIGFLLEEILNLPRHYNGYAAAREPSFGSHCFRPVVERKTNISIFTAMLKPSKVDA